jgi:hypothetical protein
VTDGPFSAPTHRPQTPLSQPGQVLFEAVHDRRRLRCDLRDHALDWTEAQFFVDASLLCRLRFPGRTSAIRWAEQVREAWLRQ